MDAREKEVLITQLLALRAQCDASLAVLGVAMVEGTEAEECKHPPEKRVDHGVMGGPERWECTVCGYEHNAPSEES